MERDLMEDGMEAQWRGRGVREGWVITCRAQRLCRAAVNGAKKTLTKLQFITDLPSLLEQCVLEGQYEQALQYYKRAQRILSAVGSVASFQGIRDEAELLMRRLAQLLNVKLQDPEISVEALGNTTRLLLQLDSNEESILKDYLLRRRRALLELLDNFPPPPVIQDEPSTAEEAVDGGEKEREAPEVQMPSAAGDVLALGELFMPQEGAVGQLKRLSMFPLAHCFIAMPHAAGAWMAQVVQLQKMWDSLFMGEVEARVLGDDTPRLSNAMKGSMVEEVIVELTGGFIEMCRQRLQEETLEPTELLLGLRHLMDPIEELHTLMPQAKRHPRPSSPSLKIGIFAAPPLDILFSTWSPRLPYLCHRSSSLP
ncbi:MAG: hypothetical protein SGPRY_006477 [Prymnesium sp.]